MGILGSITKFAVDFFFPVAEYNATPATLTDGQQTALQVDPNGNMKVAPQARYNATPPTLADGAATSLQFDASGNLKTAEQFGPGFEDNSLGVAKVVSAPLASAVYAPSVFVDFGAAVAFSVKATQGNLLSIRVTNVNAAVRYLQIHSKASVPVNPNVPVLSFPIPAGTATAPAVVALGTDFLTANGINLAAGIAIGISTTAGTFTGATAADHTTNLTYK